MVPTFTKFSNDHVSIEDNEYYKELLNLGLGDLDNEIFSKNAKELSEGLNKIKEDLEASPVYDYFICSKISAASEKDPDADGIAPDRDEAIQLYNDLTAKGFKVFLSCISLQKIESDASIYTALAKSNHLIVVSTRKHYLESAWVMSEWRRWLNYIKIGKKEKNSIYLYIPNYKTNPFALPPQLDLQVYSSNDYDELMNQIPNKNKKISNFKKRTFTKANLNEVQIEEDQLIDAAIKYLNKKRWDDAIDQVQEILDKNSTSRNALLYLFLAQNKVASLDDFKKLTTKIENKEILETLYSYSNEEERIKLLNVIYDKLLISETDYDLLEFYTSIKQDKNELVQLLNHSISLLDDKSIDLLTVIMIDLKLNMHIAYFAKCLQAAKANNYLDLAEKIDLKNEDFIKAKKSYTLENPKSKTNIYAALDDQLYDLLEKMKSEHYHESFDKLNKDDYIIDLNKIGLDSNELIKTIDKLNKKEVKKGKKEKTISKIKERKQEILLTLSMMIIVLGSLIIWTDLKWWFTSSIMVCGYLLFSFTKYASYDASEDKDSKNVIHNGNFAISWIIFNILVITNVLFSSWVHNNFWNFLVIPCTLFILSPIGLLFRKATEDEYVDQFFANVLSICFSCFIFGMVFFIYSSFHYTNAWWIELCSFVLVVIIPLIINLILSTTSYAYIGLEEYNLIFNILFLLAFIACFVISIIALSLGYYYCKDLWGPMTLFYVVNTLGYVGFTTWDLGWY